MQQAKFEAGELLLEQGQPSDDVYQIVSGEVEVFTEHGGRTVVLGQVASGEFLGEMGAIERRPRSASARACGPVTAVRLERWEFVNLISEEPLSAHRLITRLSERLRLVNERLVEASGDARPAASALQPGSASASEARIFSGSGALGSVIPPEGIVISAASYNVGRSPEPLESAPARRIDLRLTDHVPYRVSREHFCIFRENGEIGIRDLGSTLGTRVNGKSLGEHFGTDSELLRPGDNLVVAGGEDSPFVFRVHLS